MTEAIQTTSPVGSLDSWFSDEIRQFIPAISVIAPFFGPWGTAVAVALKATYRPRLDGEQITPDLIKIIDGKEYVMASGGEGTFRIREPDEAVDPKKIKVIDGIEFVVVDPPESQWVKGISNNLVMIGGGAFALGALWLLWKK